ncbi:DNA primase, partial [Pseudomonas coronafaciens]
RTLMRQRLTEITGLTGEAVSQLVQSAPADAPPSYNPYVDYDAMPDFADYQPQGGYEQPQEWTAKKTGGPNQKKWDNKPWGKKGKRQDFEPRTPRVPTAVEPPMQAALRTLLHHPELAEKVENASHFAAEDQSIAQLLVALIEARQKNPNLRSLQLIARWHGTEQGRLLRALAEKEWLIEADNLEQQFFDTITKLSADQRSRNIDQLIRKDRDTGLTAEEKAQLVKLLSRNDSAQNPTSTGA